MVTDNGRERLTALHGNLCRNCCFIKVPPSIIAQLGTPFRAKESGASAVSADLLGPVIDYFAKIGKKPTEQSAGRKQKVKVYTIFCRAFVGYWLAWVFPHTDDWLVGSANLAVENQDIYINQILHVASFSKTYYYWSQNVYLMESNLKQTPFTDSTRWFHFPFCFITHTNW